MKLRKKEIIIILVILAAALIWWGVMYYNRSQKDYGSITITVSGETIGTYSLGKDQVINIADTNVCTIENGQASMTDATCPDKVCMHMYPIDAKGGMIICLPNEVIIEGIPAQTDEDTQTANTAAYDSTTAAASGSAAGTGGSAAANDSSVSGSNAGSAESSGSADTSQEDAESETESEHTAHADASGNGYWTTDLDASDLDAISGFTGN